MTSAQPTAHCVKEDVCPRYLAAHSNYNEDELEESEPCNFSCMKRHDTRRQQPDALTSLIKWLNENWRTDPVFHEGMIFQGELMRQVEIIRAQQEREQG